jgi:pimeloyl-ACP methyl ester carboxylesterase
MTDVTSFDGTRLALRSWGSPDDPLLLFVHGLGLSTESWGEVPGRLADHHRVVAYDLRGHAQSGDARAGGYSLEAHARDLDAVLDSVTPHGRRALVVTTASVGASCSRTCTPPGATTGSAVPSSPDRAGPG